MKARIGLATCAIVVAGTVVPVASVQATPAAPVVGVSAASSGETFIVDDTPRNRGISPASTSPRLFYLGGHVQNPPPSITLLSINPLALLPGFIRPLFGWFAAINLEACVAGLSLKIGPYGNVSVRVARSC